jgi:radical SAM superfamily enzyme
LRNYGRTTKTIWDRRLVCRHVLSDVPDFFFGEKALKIMKIQRLDVNGIKVYAMVSILNRAKKLSICIGENLHFSNLVTISYLDLINWQNKVLCSSTVDHRVENFRIRVTSLEPPNPRPLSCDRSLQTSMTKDHVFQSSPRPPLAR